MAITDYLRIIRRRKWIVLATLAVVVGGFLGYELVKPDRYRASAEVLLNDQTAASLVGLAPTTTSSDAAERFAETQRALAGVPELARRTLRAAAVTDRTPKQLLKASSVRTKPNQDLLEFLVTAETRPLAIRLATEYARQFPIYRRELDAAAVTNAKREVRAQLLRVRLRGGSKSPLHASLSQQLRQLNTLAALQTTSAQLVRPADEARQVQPRPMRAGLIGLVLGVLAAVALALIRDATDTRLRTPVEIADMLALPLLARIPPPPKGSRNGIVSLEKPRSVEAEAFRILRTNLEFANLERNATTIMVTSGTEGEGKSTTAANLAVALAKAGKKVIAVDLDLRQPQLARLFAASNEPGITDVVLGRADFGRAAHPVMGAPQSRARSGGAASSRVPEGSLMCIGTGVLPPNPGEFIASRAFTAVLGYLKEVADVVIVDSPPLLSVGDAIALMTQVDAVLLVTRLTAARRSMVDELKRVLDSSRAACLGVAVTDVAPSGQYGYGYGYGQYAQGSERSTREPSRVQEHAELARE